MIQGIPAKIFIFYSGSPYKHTVFSFTSKTHKQKNSNDSEPFMFSSIICIVGYQNGRLHLLQIHLPNKPCFVQIIFSSFSLYLQVIVETCMVKRINNKDGQPDPGATQPRFHF